MGGFKNKIDNSPLEKMLSYFDSAMGLERRPSRVRSAPSLHRRSSRRSRSRRFSVSSSTRKNARKQANKKARKQVTRRIRSA